MAVRMAVASGNWSDVSTWDGGASKPSAGDRVYANGYQVTIDEDTPNSLELLSADSGDGSGGGGNFLVSTSRNIYADRIQAGRWSGVHALIVSGNALTINIYCQAEGIHGSPVSNNTGNGFYSSTLTNSTINIYGDVNSSAAANPAGVYLTAGAAGNTFNITGNVVRVYGAAVYTAGANTWVITGDVLGSNVTTNIAMTITGGTVTITGDIEGAGIAANGADVSVTGNLTSNGGYCVYSAGNTVNVDVTGNVTGGSNAPAIWRNTGTLNAWVLGNVISTTFPAIANSTVGDIYVNGTITNGANGTQAIWTQNLYIEGELTEWEFTKWDGSTKLTLYNASVLPGLPAETDVRDGVVFGPSSELTGSMKIPSAASTAFGVPVDGGAGSAATHGVKLYRTGR